MGGSAVVARHGCLSYEVPSYPPVVAVEKKLPRQPIDLANPRDLKTSMGAAEP